jgi:hypothetical protein
MEWLYSDVQMWHLVTLVLFWIGWQLGNWIVPRAKKSIHVTASPEWEHWREKMNGRYDDISRQVARHGDAIYAWKTFNRLPFWERELRRWLGCE